MYCKVVTVRVRSYVSEIWFRLCGKHHSIHHRARASRRHLLVEQMEDRRLTAAIDLASIGAGQGSTFLGIDVRDLSGGSVSNAGDVNGDGLDDLIIGAFLADGFGNVKPNAGESYLIFGNAALPASIDLATVGTPGGLPGIIIYGAEAGDRSGVSVSGAGDINGDGFDDFMIGADGGNAAGNLKAGAGEGYLIFGSASPAGTIFLDMVGTPGGTAGFVLYGADAGDQSGFSMSSAGDVNGDGFDDLIVGAYVADAIGNTKASAGDSYVIFGGAAMPATIDLAIVGLPGGAAGSTIFGSETGDQSGVSVSGAGDINGDGFDDLLVGAPLADGSGNSKTSAGDSYVIFGGISLPPSVDLAMLGTTSGVPGITLYGVDLGDRSGQTVSGAGDVNGDGFDDLAIGAFLADAAGNTKPSAGDSYLIFGAASLPSQINLAILGTPGNSAGVVFYGADGSDFSGRAVSGAGDVNGDGFDDLLIGANRADALSNAKQNAGESYLIFGSPTLPTTINLTNIGAPGNALGIVFYGADMYDASGISVSTAGDVNGDGFDDLLIGAYSAASLGNSKAYSGDSYVIFGGDFTASITHPGTAIGETLTGNASANLMIGGRGNDTLIGSGGADVLTGGQGNDILSVADLSFKRIVGGNDDDTLRLDGSGLTLDLTVLQDNRIVGVEAIDITGSGNNTLTLSYRDVLNISDESNTLMVRRNAGDIVNINGGWNQQNQENIGGVFFAVYRQGQAMLKIQSVISAPAVINRQIFYNRSTSSIFGDGTGNPINAIDTTRFALLPGQTTSFNNYTNYVRGLNGLVVDISNPTGTTTNSDFQFATWDGMASSGFTAMTSVPTLTVFSEGGVFGSQRLKLEFPDNVIRNTWLRVTILANSNTNLLVNDVFYFGNAVGDMNVGNINSPITVITDASDVMAVRRHLSIAADSVTVNNIFDVNKDGRVNAIDTSLVIQQRSSRSIRYFSAPVSLRLAISLATSLAVSSTSVPIDFLKVKRT